MNNEIDSNKDLFNKFKEIIKYNGYNYEEKNELNNNIFSFFEKIINNNWINANILRNKCKETLQKFYFNNKFIKEIDFLQNEPKFLNFYCHNIDLKIIEPINFALLAFILTYKIKIISLYEENKVIFYNELNPKKKNEISVFVINKDNINYYQRFLNKNEKNEIFLDKIYFNNIKKIEIDYFQENYKEDFSKYSQLILENLIFFPNIIDIIDLYKEKKTMLNSVQKELKNVFYKYKNSLTKNSNSFKKTFSFQENVNFNINNWDQDSKNDILFGEISGFNNDNFNNYNKEQDISNKYDNKEEQDWKDKGFIYKYYKDNKYGFIKIHKNNEDLFFHFENINNNVNITKEMLENVKNNKIDVSFKIFEYFTKNKKFKKAINIELLKNIN